MMTHSADPSGCYLNRALSESYSDILVALIKSSMKRGMVSYPKMLAQYKQLELKPETAPHIWIGIEEAKRFALTLYHVEDVLRNARFD